MPVSFVSALPHMPRDAVWAIFWIAPLVVIALGRWWLRERVPAAIWLITLFGYAGAWLLLRGEALPAPKLAVGGPLVAALAFSCYVVLSRRLREEWIATSLFYTGLGAFCAILPFMVAEWRPVHPADLPMILGLGTSGLLLLMFLDQSVERVAAGYLAPVLYGAVVFEDLGRSLLRQSLPGAPAWVCIVLIVAAAASAFLLCRRMEAR
jgi:drug/metabolite transporter (DMT)-like permease